MSVILLVFLLLFGSPAGGEYGWLQAVLPQSRARVQAESATVKTQSDARTVRQKAEVYNALMSEYPTLPQLLNPGKEAPEAWMSDSTKRKIITTEPTKNASDKVGYRLCSPKGGEVTYYDSTERELVRMSFGRGCDT